MTESWNEVNTQGTRFRFENDGDEIEGKLVSVGPGKFENSKVYVLEKEDGAAVSVFGSVIMDDRMSEVEVGDYVKIVFGGMVKTGSGKNAKLFKVFVKKDTPEEETKTDVEGAETTAEPTPEAE